jgi:hypothetical protein
MYSRCCKAFWFAVAFSFCLITFRQAGAQGPEAENTDVKSIRGTVVNSVTHEGIARALVSSPDDRFATLTDGEGHFEFTIRPVPSPAEGKSSPGPDGETVFHSTSSQLSTLVARKPGFLEDGNRAEGINAAEREVTLTLVPEALVVGRVVLLSSDASDRIQVELYRRQVQNGRAHWVSASTVSSRANGEFRFADLPGGSYKLLTHELLDRDPLTFDPRGQLYGCPPVYFPAAGDFASGETIQLSAGKTFQANISLVRQPYYQVKVPVANAPPGGITVRVSAQGRGPGYSLGYDEQEQAIVGLLPNGNYTLEASSFGANSASGLLHVTVKGAAATGPPMTMVPSSSILVNVKEEFTSNANLGSGTWSTGGRTFSVKGPRRYLGVYLEPADDFGLEQPAFLRTPTGPEDESLVLENVHPGRYWVRIDSPVGFASSVTYGNGDLQRRPLTVGVGGATSPIEVTMSDNGGEIDGLVEGIATPTQAAETTPSGLRRGISNPSARVYMVPLPDSSGTFRESWVSPEGKFDLQQIPPGAYRVLAFDRRRPELEYRDAEAMRTYESKGQVVRVVPGQKQQLRLQLISTGE